MKPTWLGLPLLAFGAVQAALVILALLTAQNPLDPDAFARRDSTKYLKIAKFGYFEDAQEPKAGTAGWFPGYPLVMRAGAWLTGARPVTIGRIVSALCHLAVLVLLARFFLPSDTARRSLALLLAAFFPAWIYHEAVFPLSMCTALSLVAIVLCAKGQDLAAGLTGALAAFTYPSGFLVGAALAVGILMREGRTRAALLGWLKGPLLCPLGLLAVLWWHHLVLGRWDAFFAFQRAFGQQAANPAATLLSNVSRMWTDEYRPSRLIGLQALVVAALVATAVTLWWRRRRERSPLEAMLVVHAVAVWAFPLLLGSNTSTYRQAALLVGLAPVLAHLPWPALAGLLVVLTVLASAIGVLFFDDVLV